MILSDPFPFAARVLQKTILESPKSSSLLFEPSPVVLLPTTAPVTVPCVSLGPLHGQPWTLVLPDPPHHDMVVPTTAFR